MDVQGSDQARVQGQTWVQGQIGKRPSWKRGQVSYETAEKTSEVAKATTGGGFPLIVQSEITPQSGVDTVRKALSEQCQDAKKWVSYAGKRQKGGDEQRVAQLGQRDVSLIKGKSQGAIQRVSPEAKRTDEDIENSIAALNSFAKASTKNSLVLNERGVLQCVPRGKEKKALSGEEIVEQMRTIFGEIKDDRRQEGVKQLTYFCRMLNNMAKCEWNEGQSVDTVRQGLSALQEELNVVGESLEQKARTALSDAMATFKGKRQVDPEWASKLEYAKREKFLLDPFPARIDEVKKDIKKDVQAFVTSLFKGRVLQTKIPRPNEKHQVIQQNFSPVSGVTVEEVSHWAESCNSAVLVNTFGRLPSILCGKKTISRFSPEPGKGSEEVSPLEQTFLYFRALCDEYHTANPGAKKEDVERMVEEVMMRVSTEATSHYYLQILGDLAGGSIPEKAGHLSFEVGKGNIIGHRIGVFTEQGGSSPLDERGMAVEEEASIPEPRWMKCSSTTTVGIGDPTSDSWVETLTTEKVKGPPPKSLPATS